MKKFLMFLVLSIGFANHGYAANWVKLRANNQSKLSLDKQSVIEKDSYKRAWIKIEYQSPQKNLQQPEKEFNTSKLLWYFDCNAQKSATSQVFQYLGEELTYSAAIDIKSAEFIEPVPETDLDLAMRYVCMPPKTTSSVNASKDNKKATDMAVSKTEKPAPSADTKSAPKTAAGVEPTADKKPTQNATEKTPEKPTIDTKKIKKALENEKPSATKDNHTTSNMQAAKWSYQAKDGPAFWGKLSPDFATCDAGRNQSPVNIENTTKASLKPLKLMQRYVVKDIINTGNTVQANFKEGNFLILDSSAFLMKNVQFHAPSEHQIGGKSFPLEAQFMHQDPKGNIAMLSVMITEGNANPALESLLLKIPNKIGMAADLKSRVVASELMPGIRNYYRFNGSLTTPPCTEGVRWIVMKTPIAATKAQIAAFETAIGQKNNRPTQALNGRVIVE